MPFSLPPYISEFPVNTDPELAATANRILSRVIETESGCLEFQGRLSSGYGRIKHQGENTYTHRILAARFLGDVDGRQHVHHRCHNRKCSNPSHLEILSASEHGRLSALERARKVSGRFNGQMLK